MNVAKRGMALLLALGMAVSAVPPIQAEEPAAAGEGVSFETANANWTESDGAQTVTLTRGGDVSQAADATVIAYNFSALYGSDYTLAAGDPATEATPVADAGSLIYAYRDSAQEETRASIDQSILSGVAEMSRVLNGRTSGEDTTAQVVATPDTAAQSAQTRSQMDELGMRAAELPVHFDAGQATAQITVNLVNDDVSEYNETFLLSLDSAGSLGQIPMLTGSILDDEENPPQNAVEARQDTQEADAQTGTAALWFDRTGDLSTFSMILLYKDEQPFGYVDFAPYQTEQSVTAAPGTYRLGETQNCQVGQRAVTVVTKAAAAATPEQAQTAETAQPGLDPALDTLPSYAQMPELYPAQEDGTEQLFNANVPGWMSSWSTKGSYEDDNSIVMVGSPSDGRFHKGGHDGKGDLKFSGSEKNENSYQLCTSGTGSRCEKSHVYMDCNVVEDFTGIASVTGCYDVSGLDKKAELRFGINQIASNTITVNDNSSGEVTCTISTPTQDSKYIYYENIDPSNTDDGCTIWALNGYKLNKRSYKIFIKNPDALDYTEGSYAAQINGDDSQMYKIMGSGTSDSSRIPIVYTTDSRYPQTMVGYRIINEKTHAKSDVIPLSGTGSIAFTKDFLKAYEKQYSYATLDGGNTVYAFSIQPVMAKVETGFELENAAGGTIKVANLSGDGKAYQGDTLHFLPDSTTEGSKLTGVYIKARSASNNEWVRSTNYADSDGIIRYQLTGLYDTYQFQGVYSSSADVLTLQYADGAQQHGDIVGGVKTGAVISGKEYVINDFYPFSALPKDGYVTKWTSNGRVYYGNTFNYQLDGNPDNNAFEVDFVKPENLGAQLKTGTVTGNLRKSDVNMLDSAASTSHALANASFTVTADKQYQGITDENGNFTIENFTGVWGGKYSIVVTDGDLFLYSSFTYGDLASCKITMPQFGPGVFFPSSVTVTLDGQGANTNKIQLRPTSNVEVTVWVFNRINSPYTIQNVNLLFYRADDKGNYIESGSAVATRSNSTINDLGGNYTQYVYKGAASDLPADAMLYVDVEGTRTVSGNTVTVKSGKANTGYMFISEIKDTSIPVQDDIPITPGIQSALSANVKDMDIPVIGTMDLALTGRNGGFFVRRQDANDPSVYYMLAGYSVNSVYMAGTPMDKYNDAKTTSDKMLKAKADNQKPAGDTSNAKAQVTTPTTTDEANNTAGQAKNPSKLKSYGRASKFSFYPAVMVRWTYQDRVDANGNVSTYVIGTESAIGLDAHILTNWPFSVYGVPFYVTLSFAGEGYMQVQSSRTQLVNANAESGSKDDYAYASSSEDKAKITSFVCFPILQMGLKGGVGFNNFLSAYLNGTVSGSAIVSDDTPTRDIDAGGTLGFSIGIGIDAIIASAQLNFVDPTFTFGDKTLLSDIQTISANMKGYYSASGTETATGNSEPNLQDVTFSVPDRQSTVTLYNAVNGSEEVADNAAVNTRVQLKTLPNGSALAAFFVGDNQDKTTHNYLKAEYRISTDGGTTWQDAKQISDSTNAQFGVKVFRLGDRMLVTWSEADLETALAGKNLTSLTAAEIAAMMNGVSLMGCYLDKDGAYVGEAFKIAENSGVAMSALDAVVNGSNQTCVYYTRTSYPTDAGSTVADLMQRDHTTACAVETNAAAHTWTSSAVTAASSDGAQQYRVMEVKPFSHHGVTGEVLVIDRSGTLVTTDANGEMVPDVNDRQLFLRIFSNTNGTATSALIPLTDPADCAQNIQIVENENEQYLFWNQNGKLVYLSDFVESLNKYNADASTAIAVVDTNTNTVTTPEQPDGIGGVSVAENASLNNGSAFSASMSDNGDVLLSWIGDSQSTDSLVPEDQVFGIMLKTNAAGGIHTLSTVGSPVPLTDGTKVLGSLDSVCLAENSFLTGYTQLNGATRKSSTAAAVLVTKNQNTPNLTVTKVSAPTYPMPGSAAHVLVTLHNDGLAALENLKLQLTGIGADVSQAETEALQPGESRTIDVVITVPGDFARQATLTATANGTAGGTAYTSSGSTMMLYDSYFVPTQMANLTNVQGTAQYTTQLQVTNIGNKAGKPTVTYENSVGGSDTVKTAQYAADSMVDPQGTTTLAYTLTDTFGQGEALSNLQISLGEGYDQSVQGVLPKAKAVMTTVSLYAVTVTGSYAQNSGAGSYSQGDTVTVQAGSRSGYTFTGWTTASADVALADSKAATTQFTMPSHAVSLTANWQQNASNSAASDSKTSASDGSTSSGQSGSTNKAHSLLPKTGDSFPYVMLVVVLVGSFAALVTLLAIYRKRKNKSR